MEKYRYKIDKESEEYFTFRGRWFDYIYGENSPEYALRLGETTDYFYFTITALHNELGENFDIDITKENIMYDAFSNLMKEFYLIDVKEEGTAERKTLEFKKCKGDVKLTFKNIPLDKRCFCTIEFANVRRWGDTRFNNIVSQTDKDFSNNLQKVGDFRCEFKGRLHEMFNQL